MGTEPEASKPIVKKSKKTATKKTKKPKCQKFQIFYSLLFSFVLKLLLIQNPSRTLKTCLLIKQFLLNQISPPKKISSLKKSKMLNKNLLKNLKLLKLKLLLLSLKRNLVRKLKKLLVPLLLRRSRLLPPRKTRNWEEENSKKSLKNSALEKLVIKKLKKLKKPLPRKLKNLRKLVKRISEQNLKLQNQLLKNPKKLLVKKPKNQNVKNFKYFILYYSHLCSNCY